MKSFIFTLIAMTAISLSALTAHAADTGGNVVDVRQAARGVPIKQIATFKNAVMSSVAKAQAAKGTIWRERVRDQNKFTERTIVISGRAAANGGIVEVLPPEKIPEFKASLEKALAAAEASGSPFEGARLKVDESGVTEVAAKLMPPPSK
jgi:hypothetical protein